MLTPVFRKGKLRARLTRAPADITAAQRLRFRAFRDSEGEGLDQDGFDELCWHVLVEERESSALVACYRLLPLESGRAIGTSYAAQFYDLTGLGNYPGRMVEMGRFCTAPGLHDPDILRVAWAMMTRYVDGGGIEMMFGCSSFAGTDPAPHLAAFAALRQRHLAPKQWSPGIRAGQVFRFARELKRKPGLKPSIRSVPPLLRTYLLMGGWVSDHAVIDSELNTMHVFTGLEVKAVPAARARALRAAAGQGGGARGSVDLGV